jgi:hypothetical protein
LNRPIIGVTTSGSLVPDARCAPLMIVAIALTTDHDAVVGPPGRAHAAITARAPAIVPDCNAAWSIAASCAIAP